MTTQRNISSESRKIRWSNKKAKSGEAKRVHAPNGAKEK